MNSNSKIDRNYDNNDNRDILINIPEVKLLPKRGLFNGLAPEKEIVAEAEMAKTFIFKDSASRKARRQDEKGKHSDSDDSDHEREREREHEDVDESDGSNKKKCYDQIDEETSNPGEMEFEEEETKKNSSYAAKKTVAQGMMDIALITANANQLRYIIEFNRHSSTFYFIVILICFSLVLQVAVGMALIFKGRLDIKGKSKDPNAKRINNYVVVAIFLVTIINVFIASFTITGNGEKSY